MRLRRYSVTVMDRWTPTRFFWTRAGAVRWFKSHLAGAHLWRWGGFWEEIKNV